MDWDKFLDEHKSQWADAVVWRGSKADFITDLFPLIRDAVLDVVLGKASGAMQMALAALSSMSTDKS